MLNERQIVGTIEQALRIAEQGAQRFEILVTLANGQTYSVWTETEEHHQRRMVEALDGIPSERMFSA